MLCLKKEAAKDFYIYGAATTMLRGFVHSEIQMCNKYTCRGAKAVLGMCDFVSLKLRLCCQSNWTKNNGRVISANWQVVCV